MKWAAQLNIQYWVTNKLEKSAGNWNDTNILCIPKYRCT